jgi:transcriptional regulator with XRE-family HTH domain
MTASSFPDFITARRRELELTLGDVAARLGVSPITVSNWSNGNATPKTENLVALAELLDVPPDELADMAGVTL